MSGLRYWKESSQRLWDIQINIEYIYIYKFINGRKNKLYKINLVIYLGTLKVVIRI